MAAHQLCLSQSEHHPHCHCHARCQPPRCWPSVVRTPHCLRAAAAPARGCCAWQRSPPHPGRCPRAGACALARACSTLSRSAHRSSPMQARCSCMMLNTCTCQARMRRTGARAAKCERLGWIRNFDVWSCFLSVRSGKSKSSLPFNMPCTRQTGSRLRRISVSAQAVHVRAVR